LRSTGLLTSQGSKDRKQDIEFKSFFFLNPPTTAIKFIHCARIAKRQAESLADRVRMAFILCDYRRLLATGECLSNVNTDQILFKFQKKKNLKIFKR
jgi:hypothetical protein